MRNYMIKTGAEIMDKINGQILIVTDVMDDGTGIAYPKDAEEQTDKNRVLITGGNGICFRFLKNDIRTTGIIAEVEDGKLYVNGNCPETGSLKPLEVLGTAPGKAVLTVKSRTEGKVDLMAYFVDRDQFTKLAEAVPEDGVFVKQIGTPDAIANGEADLVVLKTETITKTEEVDGEETEKVINIDDEVYVINGKTEISKSCASNRIIDTAGEIVNGGKYTYILMEGHNVTDHGPFSEVYIYNGDDNSLRFDMAVPFVAERISAGEQGIAVFSNDCIAVKIYDRKTHNRETHLKADGIWMRMDPDKKTPVPVDLTVDRDTLTVTFADPETYETVQVISVRTRDRGDIVTVL